MKSTKLRLLTLVMVMVIFLLALPIGAEETTNGDFSLPIIPVPTPTIMRGDLENDDKLDANDAIYCLRHILFSSKFEVNQNVDFDGNGIEDTNDAIYLLRHVLFPQKYELKGSVYAE